MSDRKTDLDDVFVSLHRTSKNFKPDGISGLARELGKREKTLHNKLDPADDLHQPTMGEFVAVLNRTGDLLPLELLNSLMGVQTVTRTADFHPSVIGAVLHSINEGADVSRAVEDALADDGVIDAKERVHIFNK